MMPSSLSKNHTPYIRTTKHSIETLSYLGPELWKLAPNDYKTIESLADFQTKTKTWIPKN